MAISHYNRFINLRITLISNKKMFFFSFKKLLLWGRKVRYVSGKKQCTVVLKWSEVRSTLPFLSLQFKFNVHPREVCMILAFPHHHFAYLLRTAHNSNSFRSSYRKSTVLSSNFHSSRKYVKFLHDRFPKILKDPGLKFPAWEIAMERGISENITFSVNH